MFHDGAENRERDKRRFVTHRTTHSCPLERGSPAAWRERRVTAHRSSVERANERDVTHARDRYTPFVTRDDRHERDDDDDEVDDGQTLRGGARQGDASDARERTTIGGGEREQEV